VPAGLQDRVIQAYEGWSYEFRQRHVDRQGYGDYERLDPGLLPNVYLAYRTSLNEGTEVFTITSAGAGWRETRSRPGNEDLGELRGGGSALLARITRSWIC
jgi:hypothetical protein